VGAADDPSGKSGIAHFLEHLMFRGTRRAPRRLLADHFRDGGRDTLHHRGLHAFYQTLPPTSSISHEA